MGGVGGGWLGGSGKYLLEMGGSQECRNGAGGGFILEGDRKVSLHSWQRSANPPIL